MAEATIEKPSLRGYKQKDRIKSIYAGSEYDNKILAGKIVDKYLEKPMSGHTRRTHITHALEKFINGYVS